MTPLQVLSNSTVLCRHCNGLLVVDGYERDGRRYCVNCGRGETPPVLGTLPDRGRHSEKHHGYHQGTKQLRLGEYLG